MLVRFSFYFSWICGLISLLIFPILYPSLKIGYFVPFVILIIYKRSFYRSIFASFFCGFVIDCFTNSSLFGIEAFLYTVTAASLFRLKKHLFEEKMLTLPLMGYFFSSLMTLYHLLFHLFLGNPVPITFEQLIKELFVFPTFEFIYAFLLLVIPLRWIPKLWLYLKEFQKKGSKDLG